MMGDFLVGLLYVGGLLFLSAILRVLFALGRYIDARTETFQRPTAQREQP